MLFHSKYDMSLKKYNCMIFILPGVLEVHVFQGYTVYHTLLWEICTVSRLLWDCMKIVYIHVCMMTILGVCSDSFKCCYNETTYVQTLRHHMSVL